MNETQKYLQYKRYQGVPSDLIKQLIKTAQTKIVKAEQYILNLEAVLELRLRE